MSRAEPLFLFRQDDFKFNEEKDFLGAGAFGQVFHARFATDKAHRLPDYQKESVALKMVTEGRINDSSTRKLLKEADILLQIPVHSNVVTFLGMCIHARGFALVLEYLDAGNLAELLGKLPVIPWSERLDACKQIACGMNHLHSLSLPVIHMDLTSANVLTDKTTHTRVYKVADFGLSKIRSIASSSVSSDSGYAGTLHFVAPERLESKPVDVKRQPETAKKVDIYSFGIIMYHIKELSLPCEGELKGVVITNARDGILPPVSDTPCPVGFNELMTKCYHKEAVCRPPFQDICVCLDTMNSESYGVESCEAGTEDASCVACDAVLEPDQSLEEVPPARAKHESVVMADELLVWGGQTATYGGYHSRLDLFSLNMLTGKWSCYKAFPSDTPTPCYGASAAAIDKVIYSHGGLNRSPWKLSDELYKLAIEEMRWSRVDTEGTKPAGRWGARMCSVDGKLLLMGGRTADGLSNDSFVFDPQTDCWSLVCVIGSKPSPRYGHTLTAVDEKTAVLFSGCNGEKFLNDMWLFDAKRKAWFHITPTSMWPLPRVDHTVCTMTSSDGEIKLLLLGGRGDEGIMTECWILDVLTGRGEELTFDGETFGRHGHSAGCVMLSDGTIAISAFGGHTPLVVSSPCFYQWDSCDAAVLRSGLPPAGALLRASAQSGLSVGTAELFK